jgi:hypothetical protein
MTAIWQQGDHGWRVLEPIGFEDEAALHQLVADAPQLLPLAGAPRVIVLGREVRIGNGWADLLATEPTGRLVIIEVKLAKNAEARRAVVAQVLTYAAFLRHTPRATLEHELLASHLAQRQYSSLLDAVTQNTQDGSVDADAFVAALDANLERGGFRLVLVLDEAPTELVKLVGYLESVAPELTIDLVTVSKYAVDGVPVLVPQRVDPERQETLDLAPTGVPAVKPIHVKDGGADFLHSIEELPEPRRTAGLRLYNWVKQLESDGLATLWASHGPTYVTLLPYPMGHDAGLVTAVTDGSMWTWRSVFEKKAPAAIPALEEAMGGALKQGGVIKDPSDAVLAAIQAAYVAAREAASRP